MWTPDEVQEATRAAIAHVIKQSRVLHTGTMALPYVEYHAGEPHPVGELNHYYRTMVARPDTMAALDSLIAGLFDFAHCDWIERNTCLTK